MVRSVCCGKNSVKRGVWTAEEDAKILAFVSKHGSGNWTSVPKKAGLKRCGKSCRLRWTNYLRPDLKHDNFTPQEEDLIIKLHAAIGSRWSIIAQQLPGRTDNDVKNYWNTKVKKKLSQMGIDPVTHKPFSKLIADYGNIGGSCHKPSSTQMRPINNDSNNALILLKSEPHHQTMLQGYNNRNTTNNGQPKQSPTSPPKIGTTPIVKGASNCIDLLEDETILLASMFGESCLSKTPSSSPSTSSTCSNSTQEPALHVPISWNDFLLEDAFAVPHASDNQEEQEIVGDMVSQIENVTGQNWDKKEVMSQQCNEYYYQFSPSSSDISFVEAMLDQENEMFLSFPHLLEEPSHY